MEIYEAIKSRRSIRKFEQKQVPVEIIEKLIDCARMSASAANLQPIKYAIINKKADVDAIFPLTKWAGYLENGAPSENEAPTAYIAIIGDDSINKAILENEAGLVMSTIMIAAAGEGLGSCCLGAILRDKINELLHLEGDLHTLYLIALGYPMQKSQAVEMKDNQFKYYLEGDELRVPKRTLDEIIIKF